MKARRQKLILRLIRDHPISTQEELTNMLRSHGIRVTQATVSRDIKELQLIKVTDESGRYRYTVPEDGSATYDRERLLRVMRDTIVDLDVSENILVVKTLPAVAAAAAEAIDRMEWPGVVGTVAGDNTVLVVAKPREAAEEIMRRIQDVMETGGE